MKKLLLLAVLVIVGCREKEQFAINNVCKHTYDWYQWIPEEKGLGSFDGTVFFVQKCTKCSNSKKQKDGFSLIAFSEMSREQKEELKGFPIRLPQTMTVDSNKYVHYKYGYLNNNLEITPDPNALIEKGK